MPELLLPRTTIAIVWDFDKTLIPGCMQEALFRHFGVDGSRFWQEVNALPQFYLDRGVTRTSKDTLYLNHILAYVRAGRFAGLNNRMLRELGNKLEFYPGLPDFFPKTTERIANSKFAKHHVTVEHYIVSAGLREMIMGSSIAPHADDVWACEFAEASAEPGYLEKSHALLDDGSGDICEIAYAVDNTSKTRALFEINKGCNRMPETDVNAPIARDLRRVPFRNMVYIGDGPSDVPCFSLVGRLGGRTCAVYKAESDGEFQNACDLRKQQRVESFGEADYSDGSPTAMWITKAVEDIAERIVRDRQGTSGSIEPRREAPDALEVRCDPPPKKSPGVARIGKAKDDTSDAAQS